MRGSPLVLSFVRLRWGDTGKILPTLLMQPSLVFVLHWVAVSSSLYSAAPPELFSPVDT